MSSPSADVLRAAAHFRRILFRTAIFLGVLALAFPALAQAPARTVAAVSPSFNFNWSGAPGSPQPWVPGQVNDWDLVSNIDGPTDANGSMQAGHGADCGAPPASHAVSSLADSAFICKGHMMTAINGGGNAFVGYGAVYFAPAQLLDWSQVPANLSWKVSTQRQSTRDWWQVNLTPFDQNMVYPLTGDVAYQGEPPTGLEIDLDNTNNCGQGTFGSILRVYTISGGNRQEITQQAACIEGAVGSSAQLRSQFQVSISGNHLKVFLPGTSSVWYDGPLQLPFQQAVVQFSHHSYNPGKGENPDGSQGSPNTYHWSDVSISPATPFTMLRPQQPLSLHEGQSPLLALPQPAPKDAFLRFGGLGDFQVSFDGGASFQPARRQGPQQHPEHFSGFWTPVPAGTTSVVFRGQRNSSGLPWWVQDVSVWAQGGGTAGGPPPPPPTPTPPPPASGPSFRSASQSMYVGNVDRPAGVKAGDFLLATLEVDADAANVTPPPGWTLLRDVAAGAGSGHPFHALAYYRIASPQEPAAYSFQTHRGIWVDAQVLAYGGIDGARPVDGSAGRDAGVTATPASPVLKAGSAHDLLVLVFVSYETGQWTAAPGTAKRTDFDGNTAMDQLLGGAGAVGPRTARFSAPGQVAALAVALRPAPRK
jgi:hypothetical protein